MMTVLAAWQCQCQHETLDVRPSWPAASDCASILRPVHLTTPCNVQLLWPHRFQTLPGQGQSSGDQHQQRDDDEGQLQVDVKDQGQVRVPSWQSRCLSVSAIKTVRCSWLQEHQCGDQDNVSVSWSWRILSSVGIDNNHKTDGRMTMKLRRQVTNTLN